VGSASAPNPTTAAEVERLFREHGPFVWRSLRRIGMSESDADDLTQEVFVIVFRRFHEFEQRSSLRTWLYGIAARVALAHRRRAQTQREIPTEAPPELAASDAPDQQLADHEARRMLDRALDTLDDDKRAVFVLYEIEELSMAEIAEALECPVQTAYSRLHAARDKVEAFFRRPGPAPRRVP
jgi:RNA polymerase sigma-70 factor (ECF subfamily)